MPGIETGQITGIKILFFLSRTIKVLLTALWGICKNLLGRSQRLCRWCKTALWDAFILLGFRGLQGYAMTCSCKGGGLVCPDDREWN